MAAKFVSKLSILLGINASGVSAGAAKAEGEVRKFTKKVDGAARNTSQFAGAQDLAGRAAAGLSSRLSSLATGFAGMVAASAAAAVSIGKMTEAFSRIDKLAKTADKLGETTEALAGFQLAADLTGVNADAAAMSLQRMVRRLAEAADGSGTAVGALDELGLSAAELSRMAPTAAFARIADAMNQIEDPAQRVKLAFALFGREGVGLVNTLKLGSAGLAEVQKEAERLGLTVRRELAAGVEEANDAVTKMNSAMDGLSNTLAVTLAPAVTYAAESITVMITSLRGIDLQSVKSAAKITAFVATVGLVLTIAPRVVAAVRAVVLTLRALATGSIIARASAGDLVGVLASLAIGGAVAIGVGVAFDKMTASATQATEQVKRIPQGVPDIEQMEQAADGAAESIDRAAKAADEWARIGSRITESVKTPSEKAAEKIAQIEEALSRGVISWETYQRAIEQATASLDEMQTSSVSGGPVAVGAAVRGTTSGMEQVQRSREAGYQMVDLAKRSAERDQLRNRILDQLLENMRDVNRKTPNNPDRIEVNEVRI